MKVKSNLLYCLMYLMFLSIVCPVAIGKIIYVDDDAAGANDGSSWENAYIYLQDALTDANSSEKPVEICVAQGVYKPNQGQILNNPPVEHPEWAKFYLINNVTIKGGYAGINKSDPNLRNIELYKSILSGDLNGNDVEVNDPRDLLYEPSLLDNSINVVYSYKNDANAVLDGFTIKGGRFSGFVNPEPSGGAGMIISKGNPTIISCTFTGNAVSKYGGGILIKDYGNPTLIDCTFTKNYASSGAGVCIWILRSVSYPAYPTFNNCVFNNNYTNSDGAGMYNFGGNIVMSNCTFIGNFSESSGGGLYTSGTVELDNCIFTNNSTMTEGGGIVTNEYSHLFTINNSIFSGNRVLGTQSSFGSGGACSLSGDQATITNSTFNGNWAEQDSAIAKNSSFILNISNCIIWNGQNVISDSNSSTLTVSYSDIQGGWEGEGNIDKDPLFANPGYWADVSDPNIVVEPNDPNAVWIDGDYHLKSQAGRWDPNSDSWVIDDVTSPCTDAGDPNTPIGDEPFPNGGIINMGAYGGTAEASKSPEN